MNKKILCILQLPPPSHGASMMNSYLIKSKIINQNFILDVIDLQFSKSLQQIERFSLLKVFKSFRYIIIILKKMVQFKPDLVYFTLSPKGYAFYRDAFYIFLLKAFKAKIVLHLHVKGIEKCIQNNFLKKYIYRLVFKKTNVICLSKILSSDIQNVFTPTPYIVPNGIPEKSGINEVNKEEKKTVPQILYLSNYFQSKGILILLKALTVIKERGDIFSARLVGASGDLSVETIEKIINDSNLTSLVKAVGPLYNEDKIKEFQNADIFVFPTFFNNEAFPLVILEALQFGLPIITTFEGGIPEIITNNEVGLLVESQNVEILADKISLLINNQVLRNEMGKKGYEKFKNNYTLEHFEKNINNVFNDILINTTH